MSNRLFDLASGGFLLPALLGPAGGLLRLAYVLVLEAIGSLGREILHIWSSLLLRSITIEEGEQLFVSVAEWSARKFENRASCDLLAGSHVVNPRDNRASIGKDPKTGLWSLKAVDADHPILYQPGSGWHIFWQDSWPYAFTRYRYSNLGYGSAGSFLERDVIVITCLFWWSSKPVKNILEEARRQHLGHLEAYTENYQPVSWHSRVKGQPAWEKLIDKPARPMDTVYLAKTTKEYLVKDLNDFLDPATRHYYLARGVPYRRGYLFHGPPGNGKTSMIFALAGAFGAQIYTISLKNSRVTDSELIRLFASAKQRSFIVFEDIDDAGLVQRVNGRGERSGLNIERGHGQELEHQNISLSGMLNAMDGVASPDGLIIFLTSNYPDRLDPALVRSGRTDVKVSFDLPSVEQIIDLFVKTYHRADVSSEKDHGFNTSHDAIYSLASLFASRIARSGYTVADIQGYLLEWKDRPESAVENSNILERARTGRKAPKVRLR